MSSYFSFIKKRSLRLLVPVYLFVVIYIAVYQLLAYLVGFDAINRNAIIGTLTMRLDPSIGYVWIIRIFLIVMLVTPLLSFAESKMKKEWQFILFVAVLLVVQQVAATSLAKAGYIFKDWLLYVCGYAAVFALGLRMRNMPGDRCAVYVGILAFVMGCLIYNGVSSEGTWKLLQANKYPPRAYFLVYGALWSALLWTTRAYWGKILDNRFFAFIGRNTIWIYLWHIPLAHYMRLYSPHWHPVVKYILLYSVAVGIFSLQYLIVRKIDEKCPENRFTKFLVG